RYGERLYIASAHGGLIKPNQKTDQQDRISDTDDACEHGCPVDPVESLLKQLLEIKHDYCAPRPMACPVLLRKVFTSVALNLSCAPELARSIERTRISSAIADCVYALARTSHAEAWASRIVALPGAAVWICLLIWSAAASSTSARASSSTAFLSAAWASASLISTRSRTGCGASVGAITVP